MEQKENQRIRLTGKLLTDAFLKMLQEQPVHAVFIRDFLKRKELTERPSIIITAVDMIF